jgi:hypothetical protein
MSASTRLLRHVLVRHLSVVGADSPTFSVELGNVHALGQNQTSLLGQAVRGLYLVCYILRIRSIRPAKVDFVSNLPSFEGFPAPCSHACSSLLRTDHIPAN